ncbi:MAG TPA: SUMF1/EgtB/PvdO family nonheme iron enzyme [Desulfurivibrionaceae bacterium]
MPSLITLQGIDETLDNLELKPGTLKAELARVIRSYFVDDQAVQAITSIPTDEIVLKIWGPCQAEELKAKKKNFSSLKSALNKSLKDLDKAGKNQAGIILGRDNVFIVSEERKDDLLKQMGISPNSPHLLHDMFAAFKKFFSENVPGQNIQEVKDLLAEFEETQKKLRELSGLDLESIREKTAAETTEPAEAGTLDAREETGEADTVETIELHDGDELEVIEESEAIEVLDEEVEILDADELEEVVEEEAPFGEGPGTGEGGSAEEGITEEVEVLDEEVEILDAGDVEEVVEEETLSGEGLGAEEGGPAEEELTEEVEVLDETEVEEVAGEGPDQTELLDEEMEILDAGDVEEVVEEEPSPDEGLGAEEGGPAEEGPTEEVEVLDEDEVEEVADEGLDETEFLDGEVEILDADAVEEVLEEETSPGEGLGAEEGGLAEEGLAEEVEVLDEAEVEEVAGEGLDETEFLDGEVEILEEEELEEVEEAAEPMVEKPHQPTPLEVLSKYIEAEEAVNQGELLRETQEEFINQILERFMPKFIKIPAGSYLVGSASPKGLEQPLRKAMLQDFYLGQAPVTNDLFDMFVRETGYTTDAEEAGYGIVFEGRCTNRVDPETGREIFSLTRGTLARHVSGANWRHPAGPGSSLEGRHNHPVVQVSHHDAMAFAAWAGKRLPTEEEWEAAARGANGQLFPWGDRWLVDHGNFEAACFGGTTSVEHYGRKAMSPFGILDLLGNVAEWTSSPHAGQADSQPGRSGERIYILKGGAWITGGTVTAAWRQIEQGKYWANTIGFRCAV